MGAIRRTVSVAVATACIAGVAGADSVKFERDGRRGDQRAFDRSDSRSDSRPDRAHRSQRAERSNVVRSTRSQRWGERWSDRWGMESAHRARSKRDARSIERSVTMRDIVDAVIQRLADDAHAGARRGGNPGPTASVVTRVEIEDQDRRDRRATVDPSTPVLSNPGKAKLGKGKPGKGKSGAVPIGSGNSHVGLALANPSAAGPANRGGGPVTPLQPGGAGSAGAGQSGGLAGGPSAGGGASPLGPGGPGSSPVSVPLPTSAGLGLAAMGVLAMRRRR